MNRLIQKETNPDVLRKMLAQCEWDIEKLAYKYDDGEKIFNLGNKNRIRPKLEERADILDRLFELHFTATDYVRLSEINSMLETYEKNMISKHIDMYKKLKEIDNNYTLYSHLVYRHDDDNPQLQPLEDDSYYGSNWNRMIKIIDAFSLFDFDIFECCEEGFSAYDEGWRESIRASFFMAPDIKPCYSLWDLLNEHGYSFPDVLQMTTYNYVHEAWATLICNV